MKNIGKAFAVVLVLCVTVAIAQRGPFRKPRQSVGART